MYMDVNGCVLACGYVSLCACIRVCLRVRMCVWCVDMRVTYSYSQTSSRGYKFIKESVINRKQQWNTSCYLLKDS